MSYTPWGTPIDLSMKREKFDLDYVIHELKVRKVIFEDELNFREFLFEYACQTAEWEGMDPKKASTYIKKMMYDKASNVLLVAASLYSTFDQPINLQRLPLSEIEGIVRKEHGGGVSLTR